MITEKNSIVKIHTASLHGCGKITVEAQYVMNSVCLKINDIQTDKVFEFHFEANAKTCSGEFVIEKPLLWSVNQPNLYSYTISICGEGCSEEKDGTFGFRTLSTNGKDICLNDIPVYVRGYIRGTIAHDHKNNGKLSENAFYEKNIKAAKNFGFNYVRFHSVVPDESFFDAADKLGLMVHVELRPPYDMYNNLEEMVTTGNAVVPQAFLEKVINGLYNHPSLTVYCIGNEIKHLDVQGIEDIYTRIQALDDTRLFLDTCAWGANNRPYVDLDVQHLSYYFPFGAHASMYEDTDNLLVVGSSKDRPLKAEGENANISRTLSFQVPLIAHEVCHYTALRDFKGLKAKFEAHNTPCPWWIDEELKMIEAKGFSDCYEEMYKASKHFQRVCWKTAYEAMRTSKLLGGFHFLQFADTDQYENSNGIVDCFDDENYIEGADFLRFNGDRVLVATLGNRLFYGNQTISVPIAFSNCGEDTETCADFSIKLSDETGKVYATCVLNNLDVSKKGLYDICKVRLALPSVKDGKQFFIKASLKAGNEVYAENEWAIWVFEKKEALSYQQFVSYEKKDCLVTNDIGKALQALMVGKKVCLVYRSDWTRHVKNKTQQAPMYAFKATWNRFKPVIWDRGTNYGGICDKALLEKFGFPTGRYYDFNYNVLSEDCDKIILDDFPCKVTSIISGIDKSCRDRFDAYKKCFNLPELMYDRTLRDFSYLFECQVGEGKLLVCGLNMTGLDVQEPSTVCMANWLLAYLQSEDFDPTTKMNLQALEDYLKKCAETPIKERMMTQFWQLDDAPVESKQYWDESRAYLNETK